MTFFSVFGIGYGVRITFVFLTMSVMFFTICALFFLSELPQPSECLTRQAVFHKHAQKYLANHVIDTKQAGDERECGMYCVGEESCASVNYKFSGIGKGRCELNYKTHEETSDDKQRNPEFNHLVIVEKVRKLFLFRVNYICSYSEFYFE